MQAVFDQVELSDNLHDGPADPHHALDFEESRDGAQDPRGLSIPDEGAQSLELSAVRQASSRCTEGGTPTRDYPEDFSWSHTKDGMLRACARRFGLH